MSGRYEGLPPHCEHGLTLSRDCWACGDGDRQVCDCDKEEKNG